MSNIKSLGSILRFLLGIGLAYLLIHFTLKSTDANLWSSLRSADKWLLLLAILLYGIIISISIYRWNLLLRVQDMHLGFRDIVRLSMTGIFFNLAIPGAVGGDILKMAFLARQRPDKRAETVLTIFLDRAIGIFGLFIVAAFAVLYYVPFLLGLGPEFRPLKIAAFSVGLGSVAGILGIILVEIRENLMRLGFVKKTVSLAASIIPVYITSRLKRLITALDLYRQYRTIILSAILLSVLIHAALAVNLFIVGAGLGEHSITLSQYFLAAPVSNAIAVIPITPAGIGTRDALTALFFKAMQATGDITGVIPVTMTLIILFWGLVGGVVFAIARIPVRVQGAARLQRSADIRQGFEGSRGQGSK